MHHKHTFKGTENYSVFCIYCFSATTLFFFSFSSTFRPTLDEVLFIYVVSSSIINMTKAYGITENCKFIMLLKRSEAKLTASILKPDKIHKRLKGMHI